MVLPATERYFVERGGDDERVSHELSSWTYLDRSGKVLSADPDHFRFTAWNTLYRGLLDAFGPDRYHLDSEMVGFHQGDDTVVVELHDRRTLEGDLLVCADGVSSTGRGLLLPDSEPVYAGYVAWRGVTRESALSASARSQLEDAMLYQVLGRGHILVYAIPGPDGSLAPGSRLVNFVWYRNYDEGVAFDDVMTDAFGDRRPSTVPPGLVRPELMEDLHATAEGELAPVLAEVVSHADEILVQAIFDLESPRMVFGRVCLIGDAAFVVRPHLAAGQAKACADAWALHDALEATGGDVSEALIAWEPRQLDLGRSVVDRSRRMGRRSQEGKMTPGDPSWKFGLYDVGSRHG